MWWLDRNSRLQTNSETACMIKVSYSVSIFEIGSFAGILLTVPNSALFLFR